MTVHLPDPIRRQRPWARPDEQGPWAPALTTPDRRRGSVRRTTTIDSLRPDGFEAPLEVDARGRDLVTAADGTAAVTASARVCATATPPAGLITRFATEPDLPVLAPLVGRSFMIGFRRALAELAGDEIDPTSIGGSLLDDLPGASLVTGYAMLHAGRSHVSAGESIDTRARQQDVCAGWRHDGTMITSLRAEGLMLIPHGPPAPSLLRDDDPAAWHAYEPLTPYSTRRRRRIDVWVDPSDAGLACVDALFRDSHMDGDGQETVVHEYSVSATVARATGTIVAIEAAADVLPWVECPESLASAERLVGRPCTGLREHVRKTFGGITTCTHLNDTLRTLEDVSALLAHLPSPR